MEAISDDAVNELYGSEMAVLPALMWMTSTPVNGPGAGVGAISGEPGIGGTGGGLRVGGGGVGTGVCAGAVLWTVINALTVADGLLTRFTAWTSIKCVPGVSAGVSVNPWLSLLKLGAPSDGLAACQGPLSMRYSTWVI